ncbi:sigma-54-dependent transcriptional regulator [Zobellella taiwanensis]|uniref:Sigma-54-dependent Fis family transcriptional regulator n=1 Tax=Zobellella taiwanensis TaxID=347535 RepID=A0A2P7QTL0_9GAMM|nr:sigma-54 dependent transcriptional regulator [Zobellella taiwanensis]PSJ41288.1 sigma-54-dependent Fis family transcriptional regulator [Zobellella taiwanensis]
MPKASILLIEDDAALAELLLEELEAESYRVRHAGSAEQARVELEREAPDLVISDVRLPGADGLSLLPLVKGLEPAPAMLIITAFGTVSQAVAALKAGADDFLTKPFDMDHCLLTVARLLEHRGLRQRLDQVLKGERFHDILGQSLPMRRLFQQIRQVAGAEGPVLVLGESGTGKELVARALHRESARAGGPFLAVNCAGIPGELLESEFFGHASGAFTGASKARTGLLREADGGTLLLDEIGEMPLELQAKLLRVLQEGTLRPVGSDRELTVDVRIIAATHRDLEQKVAEGSFRQDLFFRLETFSLRVPPLRERGEDIERLALLFLQQGKERSGKGILGFGPDCLELFYRYPFPGNVRELQNAVERALVFCEDDWIQPEHLPVRMLKAVAESPAPAVPGWPDRTKAQLPPLSELQRDYVRYVLQQTRGNKQRAAEILGVTRRTLYRWLEQAEG